MSKYEELYAKLWRKQAWREGHRPGFPQPKERFTGGIDPSKLEAVLEKQLRGKDAMTTYEIASDLGWHRKRVAEVLYTLERKGKAVRAEKVGHSQKWRAA